MVKLAAAFALPVCCLVLAGIQVDRHMHQVGVAVSDTEAVSIVGGCVKYVSTTSRSSEPNCPVLTGRVIVVPNQAGDETFRTSYQCGTYHGKSCGAFAETKHCAT